MLPDHAQDRPVASAEPALNPSGSPPSTERPVVLRAHGLERAFGRVRAVAGLDLTVRAGEIYGFLGVNGAGKTTTIRMLMGIIKPDDGTIELLGQTARRTTLRQKQGIGYVSQEQTFYPWMTCRALGRFVGGFYPTWDAGEFDRLLRVLDVPPDRKASQLSGGMKVKLALALALAPRPALLILDEPTSGLDPVARREFLDLIQRQARDHQRTTFFSSHLIGEVERVADRVGVIHHGRMRYEGDLETLRASVREVRIPVRTAPPPLSLELPTPVDSTSEARATLGLPNVSPAEAETPSLPPTCPPGFVLPADFTVLREDTRDGARWLVLEAPPAAWTALHLPEGEIRPLSLEDIFIALVGTPPAVL